MFFFQWFLSDAFYSSLRHQVRVWNSQSELDLTLVCPLVLHQSLATHSSHFKTYMPRRHPNSDSDFPIMQEEMSAWAVILRLSHKIPPAALKRSRADAAEDVALDGRVQTQAKILSVLLEISYLAICLLPPVKKPGFIFLNKLTLVGPFTWTPRLVSVL